MFSNVNLFLFDGKIDPNASNCLDPDFDENYCPGPVTTTVEPTTIEPTTMVPTSTTTTTTTTTTIYYTTSTTTTTTTTTAVTTAEPNLNCFFLDPSGLITETGYEKTMTEQGNESHNFKHKYLIPLTKPTSTWKLKISFLHPTQLKSNFKHIIDSEERENDFVITYGKQVHPIMILVIFKYFL